MSDSAAAARRALALVDLTDLGDTCNRDAIDRLCARALGPFGSTAAVCVWPRFVAHAASALSGSGVRVATVVNFPDGGDDIAQAVGDAGASLVAGADEIDLVLPYRSFLAGRANQAAQMIDAVRTVSTPPIRLKVILETGGYPTLDSVREAARLAIDHGADFVKTSTGKTAVSATMAAAVMILDAIRGSERAVGFKPSGGIRNLEDASRYLAIADEMMGAEWACADTFRFGASGLLDALEAVIAGGSGQSNGEAGDTPY